MNFKSFNLFTALVSIILIVLTMLLINAMIQSEATANNIISETEEQARLEAAAQMAKNEAVQLFNYLMRQRIETWLTGDGGDGGYFTVTKPSSWADFDEMINEFVQDNFSSGGKSSAFAGYIARSMCALYDRGIGSSSSRFSIYVPDCTEKQEDITSTITAAINKAVANQKFFEVIDCDGTPSNCEKGTFYVYLPLADISIEEYEKLPRIIFKDNFTGRTIKEVILPRQNLKLYVPIRLFKALTWARAFAHSANAIEDNQINSDKDYGVLSPRIHNELEIYGLGLCDKTTCMPRTNPATVPEESYWKEKPCPNDKEAGEDTSLEINFDGSFGEDASGQYKLTKERVVEVDTPSSLSDALSKATELRACFISEKLFEKLRSKVGNEIGTQLKFLEGSKEFDCVFNDVSTTSNVTSSKQIVSEGEVNESPSYSANSSFLPNTPFFNGSCSLSENQDILQAHQLGAYKIGQEIDFANFGGEICKAIQNAETAITASCVTISQITYNIAIRELNEDYMVNKELYAQENKAFKFKIVDTFSPFNPNSTNCSGSACVDADCIFTSQPTQQNCKSEDWTCTTKIDNGGSVKAVIQGCYPSKNA